MNKLYKFLLALTAIFFGTNIGWGQTVFTMPTTGTQTVSNCIVNFFDNGGAAGNYANNVNGTITFTPATGGTVINVTFNSFNLENNADFLYVYDGTSTTAPLIGTFTGNSIPPSISATNPNGALTFKMVSDAQNVAPGFDATISCLIPCGVDSAGIQGTPALVPYGTTRVIKICEGQPFSLAGQAYINALGNANNMTYKWTMGDGTNYYTQTINHNYPATGIYQVLLQITDTAAQCYRQKSMKVFVTQIPNFTGTTTIPDTVCQGDTFVLSGKVDFPIVKEICAPPVADTTFLPDGTGQSYQTSIAPDCFDPAEVITAATDLTVYMNMEHSYLGDLEMRIICPNNQSAILKQYPGGGGTHLGGPNDPGPGDNIPGIGWTYTFDQNATWGTMLEQNGVAGFLVPSPGFTAGNALPQGEYKPFQNFASLIGCPLNGNWTLQVTDNLGSDNGFIFFWGINFDPKFESNLDSFKNVPVTTHWTQTPNMVTNSGDIATAVADTFGLQCYTYNVTNDFGCSFDTTVCIYVRARPITVLYDSICPGFDMYGYTETGIYYDTFTSIDGCDSIRILNLFQRPVVDIIDLGPDRIFCQYDTILLEPIVNPSFPNYEYQWRVSPNLNIIHNQASYFYTAMQSEDLIFGARDPLGCWAYDTIKIIVNPGDFLQVPETDLEICPRDSIHFVASGALYYKWEPELYLSDPNIADPIIKAETSIDYKLIGTDAKGCRDTVDVRITVHPDAVLELPDYVNLYAGETYQMQPYTNALYFNWFPVSGINNPNLSNPIMQPLVDTRYFVTATTENGCVLKDSVDFWVKETVMDMPNAFNPNLETFKASIRGIATIESFEIFNRWGEKIFETKDINQGWDGMKNGTPQAAGVYVYIIKAVTKEGKSFKKTGNVTLIR